ncbi:hypothetical protein ACWA2B_00985 [Paenibacillus sp. CMM36]
MMKKHYRTGGSIREQAQPVKSQKLPQTADKLIASLYEPLSPEISKYISQQAKAGVRRSEIAKNIGISKARVAHELDRLNRGNQGGVA